MSHLLHEYLTTPLNLTSAVAAHADPKDPLESLMIRLVEWIRRSSYAVADLRELHKSFGAHPLESADPSLRILFMTLWSFMLSHHADFKEESRKLLASACSLVNSSTPREVAWFPESVRLSRLPWRDRRKPFRRLSLEALATGNIKYINILMVYANNLAVTGYMKDAADLVAKLENLPYDYEMRFKALAYLNGLMCCDVGTHDSTLAWLKEHKAAVTGFREYSIFWDCLTGSPPTTPMDVDLPWARSLLHLRCHNPLAALAEARHNEHVPLSILTPLPGLVHFRFLARAEAACGHAQAVRHLVARAEAEGLWHELDPFYLAVADFREGRLEAASTRLKEAVVAARTYGAEGRLHVEAGLQGNTFMTWFARNLCAWAPAAKPAGETPSAPHDECPADDVEGLLGTSKAFKDLKRQIRKLGPHDMTLLIQGETGSGKEKVAAALHQASPRAGKPFISVNCSALPENLIASELFGHVKGAFTGADKPRKGVFQEAGEGTLFLDEIGDTPPSIQVALLRVLETGQVKPVGADREIQTHCRVLAATHVDLEKSIREGRFREDLFYRLNRLFLHIPPLREREGDASYLALYFLNKGRGPGQKASLSADLSTYLDTHPWPGNVRQLANEMELMRVMHSDKLDYDVGDLSEALRGAGGHSATEPRTQAPPPHISTAPRPSPPQLPQLKNPLRRREAILKQFEGTPQLTRAEIKAALGLDVTTLRRDLMELEKEGILRRVPFYPGGRKHYLEKTGPT